jgi:SulP family sulfate permease
VDNIQMTGDRLETGKISVKKSISEVVRDLKSELLLPGFTSGLVVGVIEVIIAISFAALIFAGDLSSFVPAGIGLALVGTFLSSIFVALLTSLPGTVSGIQDAPAAILAVMSASILVSMPENATAQDTFITVLAVIALTTILCGLFFLGIGYFNLGGLVRFLPYSVVGGFLAGTGWLLVTGSITMMTGIAPTISDLSSLLHPEMLQLWLPGLVVAVIMMVILNRYNHYLLLPGSVIGAIVLFFLGIWILGYSISDVSNMGWLLGPFPEGNLLQSLSFSNAAQIRWDLVFSQTGGMVIILLLSVISLLLNASALELETKQDLDLNFELRAAGISNLFSGFFAGLVGFHQLGLSVMNQKLGARTRLVGVFAAFLCIAVLVAGTAIISYLPKFVLGGLLLFLGLDFLYEWVFQSWFKLPKSDFIVIILILVVIASVGFLEGVAVGIVAAIILFAINYSQVDIIKHELTVATFQSTIARPKLHKRLLRRYGKQVLILELQGYIFFGTANQLLEKIRGHINNYRDSHLCFLVVDFSQVTGIDSSVVVSFNKMMNLLLENDATIVLTGLSKKIRTFLEKSDVLQKGSDSFILLPDLDHGVEWCENALLESTGVLNRETQQSFQVQLNEFIGENGITARIMKYLELLDFPAGFKLIQQGDLPGSMFFLEQGVVTVQLEEPGKEPVRLNTLNSENLVGELGFYLGSKRNASVIAETPIKVYRLTSESIRSMESSDPEAAAAFHKFIVLIMADKLSHIMSTVETLMR